VLIHAIDAEHCCVPNTVPSWGAGAASTQDTALPLESLSTSEITSKESDFGLSLLLGL